MLCTLRLMKLNLLVRLAKFCVMHMDLTRGTTKELNDNMDLFIRISEELDNIPTDTWSNKQRMYLLTIMYNTAEVKSALIREYTRRIKALETLVNMAK